MCASKNTVKKKKKVATGVGAMAQQGKSTESTFRRPGFAP